MLRRLEEHSSAYTSEQAVLNTHRVRIRCFRKSYQYASIPVGFLSPVQPASVERNGLISTRSQTSEPARLAPPAFSGLAICELALTPRNLLINYYKYSYPLSKSSFQSTKSPPAPGNYTRMHAPITKEDAAGAHRLVTLTVEETHTGPHGVAFPRGGEGCQTHISLRSDR